MLWTCWRGEGSWTFGRGGDLPIVVDRGWLCVKECEERSKEWRSSQKLVERFTFVDPRFWY